MPTWVLNVPFILLHISALSIFLPGIEATATTIGLCVGFYVLRMFGITGGYHRYFAHRAFKTSRFFQFVLAWIGCASLQKGPLWWAGHHRHHHRHSDQPEDVHSPIIDGVWWSHIGWVLAKDYRHTDLKSIHDFVKYPELRFLDNYHWIPGISLAVVCWLIAGWSGVAWGFCMSTVLLYHGTFFINSLAHLWGSRRFATTDKSRNNFVLAVITLGEGWHNNHHHYQSSANQGFKWWEVDFSSCTLIALSWVGLVWELRAVPKDKLIPTESTAGDKTLAPAPVTGGPLASEARETGPKPMAG